MRFHNELVLRWNAREGKWVQTSGEKELQIILNGQPKNITEGVSVSSLLAELSDDQKGFAVERNKEIVPKGLHKTTILKDGDKLEIVQFVGGG